MPRFSRRRFLPVSTRVWWAAALTLVGSGLLAAFWWWQRPEPQFQRAFASLQARDWERLQYRELPLARRPGYEPHHSLFAGALLLEEKQFDPALRELRYARRHPETRAVSLIVTGEVLYGQGRFREAEAHFNDALRLDPTLADAHRWLAVAYYDIGLMHEAAMHLREVADLEPADPRPHRIMAVIHMDMGSPAIAIEDLQESLRRDPWPADREGILLDLAQSQLALKRFEDAQATLASCRESPEVLSMRAKCAYDLGDPEHARTAAEQALRLDSKQRLAIMVLGSLAFDDRDYERAIEMLSQAVQAAPTDYELRYTFVRALRAAGQTAQAEEELKAVEELHQIRQSFDELLQHAIEDPYNAEIRYQLGRLADRMKMSRVAESWYKAAVALNPGHRLAQLELKKHGSQGLNAAEMLRGS